MNKCNVTLLVGLLCSVFVSATLQAKEFVVSYDGFYDRLKVVNKGDFQFAQVNFYITDIVSNDACLIKTGRIITERQEYPLNYTEQAQLLLPYDKQLDTDKAVIVIEPQNDNHDCQLKLQIEAREFTNSDLNKQQLYKLNDEFDELLSDLSGFFVSKLMSFLLPEQKGVVLTFADPVSIDDAAFNCVKNTCHVSVTDDWQDDKTTFDVSASLTKVTPWITK
ncbi:MULTISPECIES: DUF2987 domain-containing protein [unclassified Pseudoalteromonas]|uniref:DUF2987 domain-containing protein n=1 Tax=unclassified Pseudoalteromonas TaxID=194690 RepID=UPI0025B31878|nr:MULTISPECIES: DUF2987 domain-containing protein [unclassified Pseudoalteromonas]MDN3377569.1 DUF2987 domain-containing protein [Pseudoalteromonas sp. APC 3893]MDN3385264.1 DUF2987 domain-containing protein [Pseudoalteromonas sp. APC 4017]